MGYYLDGGSNYYEGDKRDPSDTAVTQRPADYYDWGGSSWALNLGRTQTYQKKIIITAALSNMNSLLGSDEDVAESDVAMTLACVAGLMADAYAYGVNPANTVKFWDGFIAGNADCADKAALNTTWVPLFSAIAAKVGEVFGQAVYLITGINAEAVAADVLTNYTWSTVS